MRPPARLDHAVEWMDDPLIDPGLLRRALLDIEGVNRRLGGVRAVLSEVAALLRPGEPLTLLDVGCGGGDLPRAFTRYAEQRHVPHRIVAVDRHLRTISMARRWSTGHGIDHVAADAFQLPFADGSFDIVTSSMTLHHFDAGPRVDALRELARVARRRVVINDLERCWPNYLGARLLAGTIWRGSPARHDGPVSVLRGFTPDELAHDFEAAGLHRIAVRRRFFYRLVGSGAPRRSSTAADATVWK